MVSLLGNLNKNPNSQKQRSKMLCKDYVGEIGKVGKKLQNYK